MQYSDRKTLWRKLVALTYNIETTLKLGYIEEVQWRVALSSSKREKLIFEHAILKTFLRRTRSWFTSRLTNVDNQMLNWKMSYIDWLKYLSDYNLTKEEKHEA